MSTACDPVKLRWFAGGWCNPSPCASAQLSRGASQTSWNFAGAFRGFTRGFGGAFCAFGRWAFGADRCFFGADFGGARLPFATWKKHKVRVRE